MEGMRKGSPWVRRHHERNLKELSMKIRVEDGCLVVEKLGIRRQVDLEDEDGVWGMLTNDMELNEEVAMKVLEKIPHLNSR